MNFFHYYKSRKGEMLNMLKELVQLESPSTDKKAVNKCSSFLVQELKKNGARVTRYPQEEIGDIYVAEYPAKKTKERKEQILLLSHIDTVWPVGKIDEMPFYLSENKLSGPGVLDMKAGIVMAATALKTLNDLNIIPDKKIVLFVNSAEEIGHKNAYEIIQKLAKRSELVLCLEPSLPGGALKIQRKGRLVIRLSATGKSAHAGNPEKGVSAIEELMLQCLKLNTIRTKDISVNIGMIDGGEKANIVPENASAVLDLRFWKNEQKEKALDFFKSLTPQLNGAKIKYKIESLTPTMEQTKGSLNLLNEVKKIADSLNLTIETGKAGGGSDASIASNMRVPTLDGLGPDGEGMHAEHEHLLLSSLIERTAFLTELLCRL
ncbi:MAG: M20 family metallopeptidase [Candidatus Aminicenantes bacterium]|nr:M20 family metallopeptidase [Candidatus Aminicenantes bacterium]